MTDLGIRVQIPYLELTVTANRSKDSRMARMPSRIIHVVVRLFERVDGRNVGSLSAGAASRLHSIRRSTTRSRAPQLDAPVDARRQKQVGKIDGALERMKVDTRNRCVVGFVDLMGVDSGFLAGTVEAIADVDAALFGSDPERPGFIVGKVEAGDGDFTGLAVVPGVREFQCFL